MIWDSLNKVSILLGIITALATIATWMGFHIIGAIVFSILTFCIFTFIVYRSTRIRKQLEKNRKAATALSVLSQNLISRYIESSSQHEEKEDISNPLIDLMKDLNNLVDTISEVSTDYLGIECMATVWLFINNNNELYITPIARNESSRHRPYTKIKMDTVAGWLHNRTTQYYEYFFEKWFFDGHQYSDSHSLEDGSRSWFSIHISAQHTTTTDKENIIMGFISIDSHFRIKADDTFLSLISPHVDLCHALISRIRTLVEK